MADGEGVATIEAALRASRVAITAAVTATVRGLRKGPLASLRTARDGAEIDVASDPLTESRSEGSGVGHLLADPGQSTVPANPY